MDTQTHQATHQCGFTVRFVTFGGEIGAQVIAGQDDVHPEDAVKLLKQARELYDEAKRI